MSRQGSSNRRADGRTARVALKLAMATAVVLGSSAVRSWAQTAPPAPPTPRPVVATPIPMPAPVPSAAPVVAPDASGTAAPATAAAAEPALSTSVQVVRFQGPAGVKVEVLGPNPESVPAGDAHGLLTVGLKVGVPYRLRLSNLPERPDAELFPVIEVVGHLHRPAGIDAAKYPIRVVFDEDDFVDVSDRGRLVTQIIYLEDPEQALPLPLPKDEIPIVTLSPAEEPLKVAAALGRVMAIVRMGGRRPTPEELSAESGVGPGGGTPCPFAGPDGGRCTVLCGPVTGTPPPQGRPWLPCDEFLCDGGDHGQVFHFGGDGGLRGVDPRDALIQFDDGRRARVLPTNMVCVYAPRFAEVRLSVGPNETLTIEGTRDAKYLQKQTTEAVKQGPKRLVQNQGLEDARQRQRASGLGSRIRAAAHADLRVLSGYDAALNSASNVQVQGPEKLRLRQKPQYLKERQKLEGIKSAEALVVTGIVEGASQTVMSWKPQETVGVELPPNQPGLAVIKRVDAGEAEPGDTLTYVIQYRNMGNTPIHAVSIIDSLLPRLEYVPGSAQGPKGTVFTADPNQAGSTELRWELPGAIPPGVSGYVVFKVIVR